MLTRLYIENFALLEHVEVEFGPGLNVVTGETGAGKSVLLGALDSILGATVGADCVRTGAERCVVEGLFEFSAHADGHIIDRLTDLDIELEDGQLALRREIRASGRGRAFANGLTLPLRRLKEVGALLVDLCGQHEHQSLLDETSHARFLDESGGLADQTRQVAQLYGALQQCREALTRAHRDRQELQQQEELRRFQLAEIRAIAPQPGEEEELEPPSGKKKESKWKCRLIHTAEVSRSNRVGVLEGRSRLARSKRKRSSCDCSRMSACWGFPMQVNRP